MGGGVPLDSGAKEGLSQEEVIVKLGTGGEKEPGEEYSKQPE